MNIVYPGRVVFDHLPKTAGMAINSWLISELGAGCVTDNLMGGHQELLRQYGGEYSIISGHLVFNGEGLDPRYRYITLLRDPVDRVISWLFYVIKNYESEDLPELYLWSKEFIASGGSQLNNGLIPYISCLYINHFSSVSNYNSDAALHKNEKMKKALKTIKCYDIVGLYEEMPEFLADVSALIGIPTPRFISRVNVTLSRPSVGQISPELRQRIIELNQFDIQLYNDVIAYKKSQPHRKIKTIHVSPWQKYEPVRNRIFTTSDIPQVHARLREGCDIIHGELITFEVDFLLKRLVHELEAGVHIFDENRRLVFGTNSTLQRKAYKNVTAGSLCVSHHLIADLPAGKYTAGFAFAERLSDGCLQELAWYDVLCEFKVHYDNDQPFAGSVCLPAEITLYPTRLSEDGLVVHSFSGNILIIAKPSCFEPNEKREIEVLVSNTGNQLWVGDFFRPVKLSYHWFDLDGNLLIYDGIRTCLPESGIAPDSSVGLKLLVQAPVESGRYLLMVTIVQETVGWFEEVKDFEAAKLEVEVRSSVAEYLNETDRI